MPRNRRIKAFHSAALALALLGGLSGCVQRRYTVRSNPPGAIVIANGEEVGRTPVSRHYTFYGDREFVLMLDGYQTQRVIQPIKAPWYDNYATEFVSENLVPFQIRDDREFTYNMVPASNPPVQDLQSRGEGLRAQAAAPPAKRRGGLLGFFGF